MNIRSELPQDHLSKLPHSVMFGIFLHLNAQSIRCVGMVNKSLNKHVRAYAPLPRLYYLTSDLFWFNEKFTEKYYWFDGKYTEMNECTKLNSMNDITDVVYSVPEVNLWTNYDTAIQWCGNMYSEREVMHDVDAGDWGGVLRYLCKDKMAVLCVELHENNLLNVRQVKHRTGAINDVTYLRTKSSNIKRTHFSQLGKSLFWCSDKSSSFSVIWSDSINNSPDAGISSQVLYAISMVLKSYSRWPHHRLTRHYHKSVDEILNHKLSNPINTSEIYILLQNHIADAIVNSGNKSNDPFVEMLEFIIRKLEMIYDVKPCVANDKRYSI